MDKDLNERVCDLAAESNLNDDHMISVYSRVVRALAAEFGPTAVDSGMGGGWCDFWLRDDNIEFKLVMKPHKGLGKPQ